MVKRYYTLEEAREYLLTETQTSLNNSDFLDLASRKEIDLCFFADLEFAVFSELEEGVFEHDDKYPNWGCPGYYALTGSSLRHIATLPEHVSQARLIDNRGNRIGSDTSWVSDLQKKLEPWQLIHICKSEEDIAMKITCKPAVFKLSRESYLIKKADLDVIAKKMGLSLMKSQIQQPLRGQLVLVSATRI